MDNAVEFVITHDGGGGAGHADGGKADGMDYAVESVIFHDGGGGGGAGHDGMLADFISRSRSCG